MLAIESLIREHQTIGRLVDALEAYALEIRYMPEVDVAQLAEFAAVFIEFAECLHHEKEESILLPALGRSGVRWEVGVLPAVRREHRQEAYLIAVLRQAGERAGFWSAEDRRQIAATAQALVEFQRAHHALESAELLPLVASQLGEQQQADLKAALERFDARHASRRRAALARIERLVVRYAPASRSGVYAVFVSETAAQGEAVGRPAQR